MHVFRISENVDIAPSRTAPKGSPVPGSLSRIGGGGCGLKGRVSTEGVTEDIQPSYESIATSFVRTAVSLLIL